MKDRSSHHLRIMHLVTGLDAGGAERLVYDLSLEQHYMHPVTVSITDADRLLPLFEKAGLEVVLLNMKKSIPSFFRTLKAIIRMVDEHDINILHCHMFHPLLFSWIVKILRGKVKVVFTSHSFVIGSALREWFTFLTRPFRNADIIFSKRMKTWIYKKKNTFIVPNGIKLSAYSPGAGKKNAKFTFLCAARLNEAKNHSGMVKAVALLKDKGFTDFEMWFAGAGELEQQLKDEVAMARLEQIIKFLGYREDVPALMSQCHCFMLPSLWEGMPVSIIEALASGLPVIATRVGSLAEFFTEEEILFTGKDPADIAASMEKMLKAYDSFLSRTGRIRKKVSDTFDITAIEAVHKEIYKRLLTD